MTQTPPPQTPTKKKSKGCLLGCLVAIGVTAVLLVGLVVLTLVLSRASLKAETESITGFVTTVQTGERADAYAMLASSYRETFSSADFDAFLVSVGLKDAKSWDKEYFGTADGSSIFKISITREGTSDLPFYIYIQKQGDQREITQLTTEKPPESKVKIKSTTTFTKQFMKSPLNDIRISDSEAKLSRDVVDDSWDQKVGPSTLHCRIDYRRAKTNTEVNISWKAEMMTDWGVDMVELGPIKNKLEYENGWFTIHVSSGKKPFPAGRHRIEVFMGEKKLGMKEWSMTE